MRISTIDDLADALRSYRIPFGQERQMHLTVTAILCELGLVPFPEHRLSDRDRIDYYIRSLRIGIECKVDGGFPEVAAQLLRYAASEQIDGLVLVTRCSRHARGIRQPTLAGKPLRVVYVGGSQL